ncbi:MAG: hypothetical protein WD646_11435 [Actinomycetota bacterium]
MAALAELSFEERVNATTTVSIDDDVWVISRPSISGIDCRQPSRDGDQLICDPEYGEVLHLDKNKERILRAYPLPAIPPTAIAITDDAVYCARQGDGGLPNSMACRIDRTTLDIKVRIFPSASEPAFTDPDTYRPDTWTVSDESLEVYKFIADNEGVWAEQYTGGWTRLDPVTLEIEARGTTGPTSRRS